MNVFFDLIRFRARKEQFIYHSLSKLLFILFIFTNFALFYYLYKKDNTQCGKRQRCHFSSNANTIPHDKRGQTLYVRVLHDKFKKVGDEWRLLPYSYLKSDIPEGFNCSSLQQIQSMEFVGEGWTKSTYKVKIGDLILSIKTVNVNGRDISSCSRQKDRYLYDCFLIAASKLVREISILSSISHPNIVKILGYCIPIEPDFENPLHTVTIFEEYGEPVNVIKMLQLSWEDRLRISLGLAKLLQHLASSKEPIALNDFRLQQFIIVDGEPKLIDVDDAGLREPKCGVSPCCFSGSSVDKRSVCVPCVNNLCYGFNEKLNILRTGGHFIKHILPHGAPSKLYNLVHKITTAFELASWNSAKILTEMEVLTESFRKGIYRNRTSGFLSAFKEIQRRDVAIDFDYRCQLTASGYGCILSVLDTEEAAEICLFDSECQAFVLTNITSWIGRRIVHLKNGIGTLVENNSRTVYVKL